MLSTRLVASAIALILTACATDGPLFVALGSHDNERVQELVLGGASVENRDRSGATPLIMAVISNNLDGARILLEHGADPNALREGRGPHGSAIFWADSEMVGLLVTHGADVDFRTMRGETPLIVQSALGNFETVRQLIAHGADVNARDDRGLSPLGAARANATGRSREEVDRLVELLTSAGAVR